jgi:hypothetical protein
MRLSPPIPFDPKHVTTSTLSHDPHRELSLVGAHLFDNQLELRKHCV